MFRLAIALLVALVFAAGCSRVQPDQISIYRMQSFSSIDEDSPVTITDPTVVGRFVKAINEAKKQPGIVNVADPQYKLVLADRSYFLWIGAEGGTIMNVEDTHTIYLLTAESADQVYRVIAEHFMSEPG